jgi:Erv1 / Alr family
MLLSPKSPHLMPQGGWYHKVPETGVEFRSTDLTAIRNMVVRHRKAMKLPYEGDWQEQWLDLMCQQNPKCECHNNPNANGFEQPHIIEGRRLWIELHAKALAHREIPDPNISEWFAHWLQRVPNFGGCACRDNFRQILQKCPVRLGQQEFYDWSVEAHNLVNVELGKPIHQQ